ncbi:MAG: hypothetical protein CM15mV148_110 [uncultured marine virus]|nr:MAG: hypothetical protein CM15mV148_110 [uncultured marine virus]
MFSIFRKLGPFTPIKEMGNRLMCVTVFGKQKDNFSPKNHAWRGFFVLKIKLNQFRGPSILIFNYKRIAII